MTSFNLQNGVIFKEGFIKMFEKHYDIIENFLIVIMIIGIFVEDFIFKKVESSTVKKWGMVI